MIEDTVSHRVIQGERCQTNDEYMVNEVNYGNARAPCASFRVRGFEIRGTIRKFRGRRDIDFCLAQLERRCVYSFFFHAFKISASLQQLRSSLSLYI